MTKENKTDKILEEYAKGLYNIAFRSGPIEDYHAEGCPIGDKEMEKINRFAYNRLGYMINLLLTDQYEKFNLLCEVEAMNLDYFDPLDLESEEVKELEKSYQLIKEFLNGK